MVVFKGIAGRKRKNRWCKKLLDSFQTTGDYYMDMEGDKVMFHPKEWFTPGCEKPFGSLTVKVMNGYDGYLTNVYGSDYMVVPKKGSAAYYSHDGVIIDCEKSYKNYLTQKE